MQRICHNHNLPIILICASDNCKQRLLCLRCADSHRKHDLISRQYFTQIMLRQLQINSVNPQRLLIIKDLNMCKEQMLNNLIVVRGKINGLIGECQDKIEGYFSKLFFSLASESHQHVVNRFNHNFTNQIIDNYLLQLKQVNNIILGTHKETVDLVYVQLQLYQKKVNQFVIPSTTEINNLMHFIDNMSLAKTQEFKAEFSRQRVQKSYMQLSDGNGSVLRSTGNGSFPICLAATPFTPILSAISFRIDRSQGNKAIALGACLENVVKQHSYLNCSGHGKGIYAVDQSSSFFNYSSNSDLNILASWNHHDTNYNQSHNGSTNLVGWSFKEGEIITLQIDYYNNMLIFSKEMQDEDAEEIQYLSYQMPIKLDAGPIYPFVSIASKGGQVTILPPQIVEQ